MAAAVELEARRAAGAPPPSPGPATTVTEPAQRRRAARPRLTTATILPFEGTVAPEAREGIAELNVRSERVQMFFLYAGLVTKSAFYLLLFWWASASSAGAGALTGIVWADVVTWIVFGFLEYPFQPKRVTAGFVFELVLLFLFFYRDSLFDIADSVSLGIAILWFVPFAALRGVLYATESVLQTTGVSNEAIGTH